MWLCHGRGTCRHSLGADAPRRRAPPCLHLSTFPVLYALRCFPAPHSPPQAQAAALNAELLARSREHVALLLGLLEDEPVGVADFYCRYHTVQLLTGLLGHCAGRLQEAILATPMSVVRLTELLGEREVGGGVTAERQSVCVCGGGRVAACVSG